MPVARAGLVVEHPGEVEAHDLAAGLGDVVVGDDARRLADDEAVSAPSASAAARPRCRHVASATGSARRSAPALVGAPRRRRRGLGAARRGSAVAPRLVVGGVAVVDLGDRALGPSPSSRRPTRHVVLARRSASRPGGQRRLELAALGRRRPRSACEPRPATRARSSSPLSSSASSSTKRSTTRAAGDDIDLVEAQLDPRAGRPELPLAPQLADRHELDERRVAGDARGPAPGRRRPASRAAPATRSAGPSSSSRRTAPPGPSRRGRATSPRRSSRRRADAAGPRSRPGRARRRRCRRSGPRAATARAAALAVNGPIGRRRQVRSAAARSVTRYLSSTSTWPSRRLRGVVAHARGSSEPAPEPGRRGVVATLPWRQGVAP